ncbi:unnamed protein product, partial [Onchocerca flexuosa]|uniref:Laminin EGF-like protein n=1 Tax=Onchocerca flexuosa TaxID=387005 RepID=A0A183I6L1_9BILA
MENTLSDLKTQLESANITRSDIIGLQNEVDKLRQNINLKKELLNGVGGRITEISSNVDGADLELKSLIEEADKLTEKTQAFQENATLLRVADVQLANFETVLPILNRDVCGAESAPCDQLCGGPGACGHCGGRSCLSGSANQTRASLEEILDQMKEFIDSSQRSSPEQIRALAEEITMAKISLTPAQIEELSNQVRERLLNINNIDIILNETRGNKTIAEALQKSAELASMRAAEIKNTTTVVREALQRAGTAQEVAKDAIKNATQQITEA